MVTPAATRKPFVHLALTGVLAAAAICLFIVAARAERKRAQEAEAAWFQVALDHYAAGRWDQAAEIFRTLTDAHGHAGDAARLDLALCLYQQGRFRDARPVFESLAENDDPVLRTRAHFDAGNCAYRLAEMPAAASAYRRTIECADAAMKRTRAGPADEEERSDATLRELRARALHNLSLAERPADMPQGSPSPTDEPPQGTAGDPSAAPGGNDAPNTDLSPPNPDEGRAGAASGSPAQAPQDILDGVLARDAGPQVDKGALRARQDEQDY